MFRSLSIILLLLIVVSDSLLADSVKDRDKEAQRNFKNKEYNQAIAIWRSILDEDPNNERINQRIEQVYDIQLKKFLYIQRSKRSLRRALREIETDYNKGERSAKDGIKYYNEARVIEPSNPELKPLEAYIASVQELMLQHKDYAKENAETQRRARELKELAQKEMRNKNYETALGLWREVLKLISSDVDARDGETACLLAMENRLVFERMMGFMNNGKRLYGEKDFVAAKFQFAQVLNIENNNREAKKYIRLIDEELEKQGDEQQRRIQAEASYVAGIRNVTAEQFDQAVDDFTYCLTLVENYKDARERLAAIDALRKRADEKSKRDRMLIAEQAFAEGLTLFNASNYRGAIPLFEKVLSVDPDNRQAAELIRRSTAALIQLEEEVVDQYSPYYDIVNSLIVSGRALLNKGDYVGSKKKWEQILNLFPKNKIAMENLLRCNALSDVPAFMAYAKQVVNSAEEDMKKNDYQKAFEKFELIYSLNPDYPNINRLLTRARDALAQRNVVNVTDADRAAIGTRLQNAVALYQQGGEENYRRALAEYRWILERDPDNTQASIGQNRIESQLRIGGGARPNAAAARFTPEQRQMINSLYNSGVNYYVNNNFQKAIDEWRRVLAIDPNHEKAKNNIKRTIAILGRSEG